MKSKIRLLAAFLITFMLVFSFVEMPLKAAEGEKSIKIEGSIYLNKMEWTDFSSDIQLKDNDGRILAVSTINKENKKFSLDLNVPYGTSKNYKIVQRVSSETALSYVEYDEADYEIQLTSTKEGVVSAKVIYTNNTSKKIKEFENIDNIIDLDRVTGTSVAFRNNYVSKATYYIGTKTILKGGTWNKDDQLYYTIASNTNLGSTAMVRVNQDGQTEIQMKFGSLLLLNQNEVREKKIIIKRHSTKDQNDEDVKSMILDAKEIEALVRVVDHGNGTNTITYSLDQGNTWNQHDTIPAHFIDIKFKRNVEVERIVKQEDITNNKEAVFEVYKYKDGEASMTNETNSLVDRFTTINKRFSTALEEGQYFMVEVQAPNGYEQFDQIYPFTVTAENYKDPLVVQVGQPDERPEEEPINPPVKEPGIINTTIKDKGKNPVTSDDVTAVSSMVTMLLSLAMAIIVLKKKF